MPPDCARQHKTLEVPSARHQILHLVAVRDAGHILFDNGSVIQHLCHVVTRRADQLDAARVGPVIRLRPCERGQKRVVHVDDCSRISRDESRRKNLHITRQHDDFDAMRLKNRELPRLCLGSRRSAHRHVLKRNAVIRRELLHLAMIRNDHPDDAVQLARLPAVQQIGDAVKGLRAEQRHSCGRIHQSYLQRICSSAAIGVNALVNATRSNMAHPRFR